MKTIARIAMAIAAVALVATDGTAQSWPSRLVTIVVPYPPGGANDVVARQFAERLTAALGQSFIIDNRAGAGGIVGSASVAKSAPDGYALLVGNNGTHVIQPLVSATARYDPQKDFTAIAKLVDAYQFLGVNADLPVRNVADLIALAKREPGKLNYGSAGSGSFGNFAGEMLRLYAGIDIVHIPYRGSGQAVADLAAGRVQFMLDPAVLSQAKGGRVRVIATTGPHRFEGLPDVPTMKETGLPEFELVGWFGLFGPAGLPRDIATRLASAVATIAADPDMQKRMLAAGVVMSATTPEAFEAILKRDLQRYGEIKKRANIQAVE